MNLVAVAYVMMLTGVMTAGFVHNPNTLLIGFLLVTTSQALMFYSGYRRGKRQ